jgi:hypothetical protein
MFFSFPEDVRWNAERQAVEFGVEIGEYHGVVRVPRRVFQRLLPESPTLERCVEPFYLQRTRFESIAERKLRRRQLTEDGNVEITGRNLRDGSRARHTATAIKHTMKQLGLVLAYLPMLLADAVLWLGMPARDPTPVAVSTVRRTSILDALTLPRTRRLHLDQDRREGGDGGVAGRACRHLGAHSRSQPPKNGTIRRLSQRPAWKRQIAPLVPCQTSC